MATAKQLAALKKGREARAKKAALGKTSVKRKTKPKVAAKVVRKKNPIKPSVYIVVIHITPKKYGYLTVSGAIDTDPKLAKVCSLASAEKVATAFFNKHKNQLHSVSVQKK